MWGGYFRRKKPYVVLFLDVGFSREPDVRLSFHAFYLLPLWTFASIFKYTKCVYMVLKTVFRISFYCLLREEIICGLPSGSLV